MGDFEVLDQDQLLKFLRSRQELAWVCLIRPPNNRLPIQLVQQDRPTGSSPEAYLDYQRLTIVKACGTRSARRPQQHPQQPNDGQHP